MSAPEFFIADDSHGEPWVWARSEGEIAAERMVSLFGVEELRHGLAMLDLIRAAVEGEVREEWGVHTADGDVSQEDYLVHRAAVAGQPILRRTVITGAWEEER